MKPKSWITLAAVAAVVAAACATQPEGPLRTLRGTDAAVADQAPLEHSYAGKGPGGQQPVARTFSTQPPVIPHTVDNLDQITLQQNPCLNCHRREIAPHVKAPAMGGDHYQDRDGKALQEVSAARYQCTLCHAPQADAKPLVGNTFQGDLGAVPQSR